MRFNQCAGSGMLVLCSCPDAQTAQDILGAGRTLKIAAKMLWPPAQHTMHIQAAVL